MPTDKKSYTYGPRPLTSAPAQKTPYDQTNIMPSKGPRGGKFGGLGKKASGGAMQGGGKRRSKAMKG